MKDDDFKNERLVPLSAMKDYKIAKDDPDVLGWRVVGADGESLGVVRDLIVDPHAMKARYLSVVADRKFFDTDRDQYMLVPIGVAALDRSGRKVFLSAIDSKSIGRYPVYDGGPIPEDYEYAVRDTYHRSQQDLMHDTSDKNRVTDRDRDSVEFDEALHRDRGRDRHITNDFYNDDTFNESRFYTSDQEVYRDKNYTTYDRDKDEPIAAPHNEDVKPRSVEDSITTIERLEHLREKGSITEEEFILMKKRALDL